MKRAAMVAFIMMTGLLIYSGHPLIAAQAAQTTTTGSAVIATAQATSFSGLTYDKAVQAALSSSTDLLNQQLQLKIAKEEYDDAYSYMNSMSFSDIINKNSTETSKKWTEIQLVIQKEALAVKVKDQMNNINQLKSEIELAQVQQSVQNTKLAIALDEQDAGLISAYAFNSIKNQKNEADKNLELKKLALEEAYQQLMTLTGLSRAEVENPENMIAYTPVQETVDTFITRQLGDNPHIWYYEQLLSGAKLGVLLYEANTGSSYVVKTADASMASNNLSQLKKSIDSDLRSKYNETMTLETNYELGQISIEKAAQDMDSAQVRYAAGLCAETEVLNARLAYMQAQVSLQQIAIQHGQDVTYLNKPYTSPGYL